MDEQNKAEIKLCLEQKGQGVFQKRKEGLDRKKFFGGFYNLVEFAEVGEGNLSVKNALRSVLSVAESIS